MAHKDKIAEFRREFKGEPLITDALPERPFSMFESWFEQILEAKIDDPTACVLATVDAEGRPDTRVVLLKDFSEETFIFYTNYHSQKAIHMQTCPWVALNFYWPSVFRQIRIRGRVNKVDSKISEAYFHSRPRDSQISAYASRQSSVTTRDALEAAFSIYQETFSNNAVIPYPTFWGGYCITPIEFEFWHGRNHRFHDRVQYVLENERWIKRALAP